MNTGFAEEFCLSYQAKTGKPVLMREWGAPASRHTPDAAYPTGVPTELPHPGARPKQAPADPPIHSVQAAAS